MHYIQNNRYSHIIFKLDRYINSAQILDLESKISIINLMKNDIRELKSALAIDYYIKVLAQKLRIEENLVQKEMQRSLRIEMSRLDRNKNGIIRDNNKYGKYGIQERILAAMLKDDNIFNLIEQRIGINFFANPDYKTLANIYKQLQGGKENKMQEMNRIAVEEGLEAVYARILLLMDEERADEPREIEEFIKRVEMKRNEAAWQKLTRQANTLDESGDFDSVLAFILKLDKYVNATREGGMMQ